MTASSPSNGRSNDGPAVTYPVPLDEEGDPLAGSDLENWLAGRWKSEIKDRVERTKSFDTVRASKRAGFRNIQAKVDANALSQQAGLNRYNAQSQQWNQLRQGLGRAIGTATGFFTLSSRAVKTGNRPADHADSLARLQELDIEHWRYRGDDAPHIGPYAEDFAAAFAGDGRSIDLMDAVGATMSAVKGLAARVEALAGRLDGTGRTRTGERRC